MVLNELRKMGTFLKRLGIAVFCERNGNQKDLFGLFSAAELSNGLVNMSPSATVWLIFVYLIVLDNSEGIYHRGGRRGEPHSEVTSLLVFLFLWILLQ